MIKIGSFIEINGRTLKDLVVCALEYGANCFMFYTGAPTSTIRRSLDSFEINQGINYAKEMGFDKNDLVVHAPYIINLANPDKEKRDYAINFIQSELERAEALYCSQIVLHPGNYLDSDKETGIKLIAEGLNIILNTTKTKDIKISLETMAGKGTEIGRSFEDLRDIINLIEKKDRISVCFDTCHVYESGYDLVNETEFVFSEFDRIIGFNYLTCFHCNDSINGYNAHKDRHANIGYGQIGFEKMIEIIYNPKFKDIPHILETPYVDGVSVYKKEIEMIKSKKMN
jgi:deoxyribonuclease-4